MKNKKIIGGALAGIVLLAAATTCIGSFVAKADSLANGRVAWYTFDDGKTENKVDGGSNAAAIVNYDVDQSTYQSLRFLFRQLWRGFGYADAERKSDQRPQLYIKRGIWK